MLVKTHLAIGFAVALYFSRLVNNLWIFIPVVILSSLIPDIDSGFSFLGRRGLFKPVQWTTVHRGVLHSYTLAILGSLILALWFPLFALPFFLGYAFHLFADSFTVQGIKPFWPLKFVSSGVVRSGSAVEKAIFFSFVIFDLFLLGWYLF